MGWRRMLLLGDLGQQMDIQEARDALERVRRSADQGEARDREQDERIERLADENEQLKLCLVTLVCLLTFKGLASPEEVRPVVEVIEAMASDTPGRAGDAAVSNDALIRLAQAAKRYAAQQHGL